MVIRKADKILVLRFKNYKRFDFISEHEKVAEKEGRVWLFKLGANVPAQKLQEILADSRGLILKSPKASGGKYYYCKMIDAVNTSPNSEMVYPEYYKFLMKDMFWLSLNGTWICVNSFHEIKPAFASKLRLISNDRPLDEVIAQTRTTMLYVYASEDLPY